MTAAADRTIDGAEDGEDQADYQHDDAYCPEHGELRYENGDDQKNDTKTYHKITTFLVNCLSGRTRPTGIASVWQADPLTGCEPGGDQ